MIEKVNPAHPDKIADRIAGALVDYAYSVQSNPRIAVEVLIGHRVCHIIAETSVHIPATFVQDTVTRIAGEGVVMDYCEVDQDAHLAANQAEGLRCGDNGLFKPHCPACSKTRFTPETCAGKRATSLILS